MTSCADNPISIVLDAAPVCASVWSREGHGVDCNGAALHFFGLASKRAWLDHHAELSPECQPGGEASGPLFLAQLRKAFAEGGAEFAWLHRRLDGRAIPARITLARFGQGDSERVVAYAVEQASAPPADAAPDVDDVRMRLMLDNAPLGCTLWNARGEVVDCNAEILNWLGLDSKQEFLARVAEFWPDCQSDGRRSEDVLRLAMAQILRAGGRLTIPWMQKVRGGSLVACEGTVLRVMQGDEPMVAVFIRDVREQTRLQAETRMAEERTRLMLDAAPLACTIWNAQAEMVDCNLEALQLFGLSSKQEYVARYAEFMPEYQPDGSLSTEMAKRNVVQALQTGRFVLPVPWMRRNTSGELIPCELTLVRVMQDGAPMAVAFLRDLREEMKLQAERREADERRRIMFDTTPSCTTLWSWDEELKLIDCNQEAANLFELGSKQEYLDRFFELSPEYQPCGRLSGEMALEYVSAAFREGRSRFEWMHRKLDGEPVPAEITLMRAQYGGRFVVVGNTRDLREEKKLGAEKREAEERIRIMLDATPLGCTFWDEQSRPVDCNQEAVKLFGLGSKREFLDRFSELSPVRQPDGQLSAELIPRYIQQAHDEGYVCLDWMHRKLDGEMLPVEITLVRVQRAEGHVIAAYIRDLRELLEVFRRINEANEYTRMMLDATPLSCNLWNEAHQMIACNQEAVNLLGLGSKDEYLGRYRELAPELQPCGRTTRELTHEHLDTAFREGRARFEWMHQKLDGEPVPVEATLVRIAHENGHIVASYKRDLRELKESVASLKRLEVLAYTDKLTRTSNRHYFMEHAADEIGRLSPGGSASLLILDIDHFKHVNDTYGHTGGDVVLQGVAARIRKGLRPDDLFARYGGEEFVILLGRVPVDAALSFAERVREAIAREPFHYQGQTIKVTISIGVAMSGHPAVPLQDLIDQADAALYQAKRLGRNRVERFQPAEETARAS